MSFVGARDSGFNGDPASLARDNVNVWKGMKNTLSFVCGMGVKISKNHGYMCGMGYMRAAYPTQYGSLKISIRKLATPFFS